MGSNFVDTNDLNLGEESVQLSNRVLGRVNLEESLQAESDDEFICVVDQERTLIRYCMLPSLEFLENKLGRLPDSRKDMEEFMVCKRHIPAVRKEIDDDELIFYAYQSTIYRIEKIEKERLRQEEEAKKQEEQKKIKTAAARFRQKKGDASAVNKGDNV